MSEPDGGATSSAQVFGVEERRAAQKLSIGSTIALDGAVDPYREALLCSVSVGGLLVRLRESGALDAEQLGLVKRLHDSFERRVQALKVDGASLDADRSALVEENSPQDLARIALGCLQRSV